MNDTQPTCNRETHSLAETLVLGERLGAALPSGTVVALCGDLGAGKTALTKGIARGLGVKDPITSPTFTLINEHPAKDGHRLYHIDLYRLDSAEQALDIGIEDALSPDGWTIVEWPEKLGDLLPPTAVRINIEILGENERQIRISNFKFEI